MPGINFTDGGDAAIDVPLSAFTAPGGVRVAMGGVISANWTAVGNTAGVLTTLMTYTIPAATILIDGHSIWFEACGFVKNTAGTKTLDIEFAGTTTIQYTFPAGGVDRAWVARGRFTRVSTTCDRFQEIQVGGLAPVIGVGTNSFDFASSKVLNIKGNGTAALDIVCERLTVGYDGV